MTSTLDAPRATPNQASDGRALRRVWHDAMTRWQQAPDQPPAVARRPAQGEQVTLTDLDPALCARHGWR